MTTFYLISAQTPWRAIQKAECRILQRKWTWAIDALDKRHLVGSSAFYTIQAAQRAKAGALEKIAKMPSNRWTYNKKHVAKAQLSLFPTHDFKVLPFIPPHDYWHYHNSYAH